MDAVLSLATTLNRTKGATALLLGSGISSAAGILTGWGITLDLVRQVATLLDEAPLPEPAAWYQNKFGEEPDYAKLLKRLAPTPTERQRLLRGYFIPTAEEREQKLKTPTAAHRAIATLVSKGYIHVILTTNFDPLLEKALEDTGVYPAVVSDVSGIKGMTPLQHEQVTIIKLHGHYLDTRLRNTPDELVAYEPELNRLLDRVFDEYGLLIAGWSGVWDTALREAILRCPTRRFSTYWTTMGSIADAAQQLVRHRAAEVITTRGADAFFQDLMEKVESLEELAQAPPVSTAVAVATLKRYLPVESQRIRLHDLVTAEVERYWEVAGTLIPTATPTEDTMKRTIQALDQTGEQVLHFLGLGAYWAGTPYQPLWLRAVTRLSQLKVNTGSSYSVWSNYRSYPLLLAFYAVGLGAVASNNTDLLLSLLLDIRLHVGNNYPAQRPAERLEEPVQQEYLSPLWTTKSHMPLNAHLERVLRPVFASVLADDTLYQEVFDEFEYFVSLVFHAEWSKHGGRYPGDFYRGFYMVRGGWAQRNKHFERVRDRLKAARDQSALVQRGVYQTVADQDSAMTKLDDLVKEFGRRRW